MRLSVRRDQNISHSLNNLVNDGKNTFEKQIKLKKIIAMALGSTQPLTEMSTRILPWG
jgi:hypothetical protein